MCDLPKFDDKKLLVGFESSDDAAVYQLTDDLAIIQTLDFFTPIVDDPYDFGSIAATNALSDIYAMGGVPTLAMNIVGFPNCLDPSILKQIMQGGAEKVKEAGAILVGGHSIEDDEPKYGLSVMGTISPDNIWRNIGALPGDVLILTKPLGIGILTTALKEGMLTPDVIKQITKQMCTLNKIPVEILKSLNIDVHACTDVTGFGLLGHALEMAEGSGITIHIKAKSVPIIEESKELAQMGIIPAGAYKNRNYCKDKIRTSNEISELLEDLLFDPQTSGGLLISIPEKDCDHFIEILKKQYDLPVAQIGYITQKQETAIVLY